MNQTQLQLNEWGESLSTFHLPRWHELPDFELYMDQVITLLDKYIGVLNQNGDPCIITSSMINNYVKLKCIPKPVKKRYSKKHIAYLIAITLLKQVLTIQEVKDGIEYQALLSGLKEAYDLFCDELENAIHTIMMHIQGDHKQDLIPTEINNDNFALKMASLSFASKLTAEKIVSIRSSMDSKEENHE